MTQDFQPWLPADTTAPVAAAGALADLVAAWSGEWFAGEPYRAGGFARAAELRKEPRPAGWQVLEAGLAVGTKAGDGVERIGAQILGLTRSAMARPPADSALLNEVGGTCLADLRAGLAKLFGCGDGAAWRVREAGGQGGGARQIEISGSSGPAVLVQVSAALYARFVRQWLPASAPAGPLGDARRALAPLPLSLSALLGTCRISALELSELAADDVLVLDRALDEPLRLAAEGAPLSRGSCSISEAGGTLALAIVQAPMG